MKDIFKYKPYKKNESFYSNLSALFLSMIIIFGPISFIFGSILFKCYAIYLDEMDVTIYAVTSLMILIIINSTSYSLLLIPNSFSRA